MNAASSPRDRQEVLNPFGVYWQTARGRLALDRPLVMGILNITPDSFSDGGELGNPAAALDRAREMVEAGAGILDVGGESTRPGAQPVPLDEELGRVIPVLEILDRELGVPLSVDTRKAEVARRALEVGAAVVNDVSGLGHDPAMASTVARKGAGVVLMHMRGEPRDMTERASYGDVAVEVARELVERVGVAREAGISDDAIVLDPGIGFAKTADQSLTLLRELERIVALGFPVLVGPSRKSFLGAVLGVPPTERVVGSAVACAYALERGARVFRVHDVVETVQALTVLGALRDGLAGEPGVNPGDPRRAPGVVEGERWRRAREDNQR